LRGKADKSLLQLKAEAPDFAAFGRLTGVQGATQVEEIMMKKLTCAIALALAAAAAPAAAEGLYAGAGYTNYSSEEADIGAVTGRLGYQFHPNIAVEGELATGVADDDGAELDSAWGVYGVGKINVSPSVELFARLGYQGAEIAGGGVSSDNDGAGYGVGGQWNLTDRFGVRADYTRLDGDEEVDTVGLSGVVKF
jgi:outer membrane immunogenic protein